MKMCKCPGCAQMIHFEVPGADVRGWNCGMLKRYFLPRTAEQKLLAWTMRWRFEASLPHFSRLPRLGRVSLVVAALIGAAMLLLFNSFDIGLMRRVVDPLVEAGPLCSWF